MEYTYRPIRCLSTLALACALTIPAATPLYATETPEPEKTSQEPETSPEQKPENANVAQLVSISDIRVLIDGKETDSWTKEQKADLKLILTSSLPTSEFTRSAPGKDPEGISVTRLSDAFKGGDPEISLASPQDKPLRLDLVFHDVTWRGKDDMFAFTLQTGQDSARKELRIFEVSDSQPEPEEPENPDQDPGTEPDPGYTGGYTGGMDGGSSEPVKIQSATPHIIISKYTYGGESVEAGKKFDLNIDFRNTSRSLGIENILMSVETEEGLTITNSSNTFFFDSLAAGASRSQKIPMKALSLDKSASPSCTVSFTYEYVDDGQRLEKTAQERIAIPVTESDRFQLEAPKDLEPAFAGQEYTLSIPYNNKGKGTVYNLEARVEGDMTTLSPKQNLGNIDSGRSGSIDLILTPQEPGEHKFKAIIAWENAAGEEVEKSFDVTLSVQEAAPAVPDDMMTMPPEEEQSSVPWGWIIAAAAALCLVTGLILHRKKKRGKPAQKSEDLQNLFDQDSPDTGSGTDTSPDAARHSDETR
ncbi:hypothetical protein [uncultured Faecalibaculum sp.]|uniref:hypothetical protein n=2 Tax=uncultured Faecalibaculum sp. TaxID=1729681 RepID=UPI002625E9BE|nr:hypothetical protein [uncultured Faecalibaculum sp.]